MHHRFKGGKDALAFVTLNHCSPFGEVAKLLIHCCRACATTAELLITDRAFLEHLSVAQN